MVIIGFNEQPWDQRAWHAAGKANDTHIAFELCEPSGFTYASGGKMVGYDTARHETYFRAAWQNAVSLCVMLCLRYGIAVENIIGHCEGCKMGIASNHADPGQWFLRVEDWDSDTAQTFLRDLETFKRTIEDFDSRKVNAEQGTTYYEIVFTGANGEQVPKRFDKTEVRRSSGIAPQ